jgi:hypothetical protein
MNTILGEKVAIVSKKPQTTRNKITGVYTSGNDQFVFIDTPGIHKPKNKLGEYMMKEAGDSTQGADAIVFIVEPTEKPWEKKPALRLSALDFIGIQKITRANMLYIPLSGLSPRGRNQLLRLAAFRNPEFYKAQAMRLPIYDKPRIICSAEEEDGYLILPRCCEDSLIELLEQSSAVYEIDDQTCPGKPIRVSFKGSLREEQQPAADALLAHRNGVLSATTAFGKTVVAAYLISQRKVNTLILVHTQALLNQWKRSLSEFLEINETLPDLPKKRGRPYRCPE